MPDQIEWSVTSIGNLADIFDGPHATPKKTDSGPWFLSISSLSNGRLDLSESAHVSEEDFAKWIRRVTPRKDDLLFSYETRLGEAALMPDGIRACLGRRMGILRPKRKLVDPRFLLYAYLGPKFQQLIQERRIHGATVDRIPLREMATWPISVPGIKYQRAIAYVLGSLDDKIANNLRVSQTTSELAETRLGLAVRDDSRSETIVLSKAARSLSGGTPSTGEPSYWNGEIPWISASSLTNFFVDDSDRRITQLGAANGTRIVDVGTTLCVVRGMSLKSEFRIGIATRSVAFGQDCKAFIARPDIGQHIFAYALRSRRTDILNLVDEAGHGTGRLDSGLLGGVELDLPNVNIRPKIEAELALLTEEAVSRQRENVLLTELRNMLLPKLMSGEILVRDAEKLVEGAV